MAQCDFVKQDGQQCGARALRHAKLCISHNPEAAALKKEAVRKGGRNRRIPRRAVLGTKESAIESVQDVQRLLYRVLGDTRDGKLDADLARTLGYVAGVAAKVAETADLEKRLTNMLEKVADLAVELKRINEPPIHH